MPPAGCAAARKAAAGRLLVSCDLELVAKRQVLAMAVEEALVEAAPEVGPLLGLLLRACAGTRRQQRGSISFVLPFLLPSLLGFLRGVRSRWSASQPRDSRSLKIVSMLADQDA
jgi:hypothetical protein